LVAAIYPLGDGLGLRQWGMERRRERCLIQGVGGPEPTGAPEVEAGFEGLPGRGADDLFPVDSGALGAVVDREFMEA